MRARYKGPSGTGIIEIDDDATIQLVFEALGSKSLIEHFTIKYGPPTAMRTIDLSMGDLAAKSFALHGETLTIVPSKKKVDSPEPERCDSSPSRDGKQPRGALRTGIAPDDIVVPWPERKGSLLLRVMPSDNSCLFTAFGGAFPKQIPAQKLRQMMADYIANHSDLYNEAILGCSPIEYRRSIRDPDRWGGGIELSILSTIFDIEICTFDVQGQHLISFGEEKQNRCILIYSGIHYDRVAFSYSDYPHHTADLPPELDKSIWPSNDLDVLEKTKTLVQKLHVSHYYTDTEGLVLKCNIPGCGWLGNGQLAAKQHAELTGHANLTEIRDVEEDNVLRKCSRQGCSFIGQGERSVRQHQADTGHRQFDIIPDM
ncbi:ubiquitin-specific protease otu1 [Conoideocrella luteorostrata]|uniref:Ubiquitin thioesterase OTU n=1 Tax=Conoideocrella luteorostrata TaxID=1105319 RepID=A0AAJ0FXY8_9HYPO|nr:ubiquitin-specific protease otu1 [Conoideocrella luteorostrata]